MIQALIAFLMALGFTFEMGHAAYYSPGVMQDVIAMRQSGNTAMDLPKPIPDGIIGYVALKDCDRVGERVALWHESEGWTFPHLVTDCANSLEGHDKRMERLDIIADVGYSTAQRWKVIGRGPNSISIGIIRRSKQNP